MKEFYEYLDLKRVYFLNPHLKDFLKEKFVVFESELEELKEIFKEEIRISSIGDKDIFEEMETSDYITIKDILEKIEGINNYETFMEEKEKMKETVDKIIEKTLISLIDEYEGDSDNFIRFPEEEEDRYDSKELDEIRRMRGRDEGANV